MPRVALVTGAAAGLGAAIARAFLAAGYAVGVTDLDADAARAMTDAIEPAMALALDVREQGAFEDAVDRLTQRWGGVDVLVNNAALMAAKPVLDITPDEFDQVMAVNARGVFVGSQVLARHFAARGGGRIVNIASLAGQNGGTATGAHYAASKGAVLTLTKVFARDLAAMGITVNAVSPGPLELPSVRRMLPPERLDAVMHSIPTGALGEPELVADLVVRLAAPDAGYITGATWDVNGGLLMR